MAECRDFFDEAISGILRSSSRSDKPSIPEDMEEGGAHCLELTLGLGPSVGNFQPSRPLQTKPAAIYNCLPKEPSDYLTSSDTFLASSNALQTSFSVVDSPRGLQKFTGEAEITMLTKQRSEDSPFAGTHTHPSSGGQADTGLAVEAVYPSGNTAFPSRDQVWLTLQKNGAVYGQHVQHPNEASSMWGRRSASTQVSVPRKDAGDEENDQIRRSYSSGVFPLTVLRQISSIESFLEKDPHPRTVCSQDHDQGALEDLRKRKELQAQRRLVARKRRKVLIEEKQHERNKHSSSLLRLNNSTQSISPNDKFSIAGTSVSEVGVSQELRCASPDVSKQEGFGKVMKCIMTRSFPSQGREQESHSQCAKVSHEQNSGSRICVMNSEFEQSTSAANKKLFTTSNGTQAATFSTVHPGPCMNEDEGVNCTETKCVDSNSIQHNGKVLQCTLEKGSATMPSALTPAPLSSNSISNSPFPFMAVRYPCTVTSATPTVIPMQPDVPFPVLPQHSGNNLTSLHGTCPTVSWTTEGTSVPMSLISNLSSASKDYLGENAEGKGSCREKSLFSPLSRTASNFKHVKNEPQYVDTQLGSDVTFPASQLSSVVSDACSVKNLLLERQQSVRTVGRSPSQHSDVQDQSTFYSRRFPAQRGIDMQHVTAALGMGFKGEGKEVEGVKQEDGSEQSQLVSERPGVDAPAPYLQSGSIQRQRSGSFPELPWVTTTGKGPNGKTINGVMYIVDGRHVRLICKCHGKHMSPVEFVEHSGSTDLSNPERSIVVCPSPSPNHQLASASV